MADPNLHKVTEAFASTLMNKAIIAIVIGGVLGLGIKILRDLLMDKAGRRGRKQKQNGSALLCPACGAAMVLRTARKGENAGSQFWGCSKYPACKGIVNLKD